MNYYPIVEASGWLPEVIDSMPINMDVLNGSIMGGSRKAFLFGVARECHRNGMSLDQMEKRILIANTKCFPALGSKELEIYLEIAMR